jgi:hypothetical protein
MPMMTAAVNEKIARRDMIPCPSLVAENREPQLFAAALRAVSFASLI